MVENRRIYTRVRHSAAWLLGVHDRRSIPLTGNSAMPTEFERQTHEEKSGFGEMIDMMEYGIDLVMRTGDEEPRMSDNDDYWLEIITDQAERMAGYQISPSTKLHNILNFSTPEKTTRGFRIFFGILNF